MAEGATGGSVALGTSFAFRPRRSAPLSPELILDEAQRSGATGLFLCAGLPGEILEPLARGRGETLPVLLVDGQLGAAVLGRPQLVRASLASLDRDEARAAAERTLAALEFAEACGAKAVSLPLGPVRAVLSRWEGLRRRFLRGELLFDEDPAERLMADRRAHGAAHLVAVLRSLSLVIAAAERRGLLLLVRNPRRGIELPTPLELHALLDEFSGAPLFPLLDVPAAHLCSAMRLWPLGETTQAFAKGPLCLLGDACGAVGALPPGHGEVDVAKIARHLPRSTEAVFVPWAGLSLAEVQLGCERVKALPRRAE